MSSFCQSHRQLIIITNRDYGRPLHCHLLPWEHSLSTLIPRKEHRVESYQIRSQGKNSLLPTVATLIKPLQDEHGNGGLLEEYMGG